MTPADILAQYCARESMDYDVIVVGGGPAGLSAAIRLKQLAAEKGTEISVAVLPDCLHKQGHFVISLGLVTRWLGAPAEALGVEVFPGFAAAAALYKADGSVKRVAAGKLGAGKDGMPGASFQLGLELLGKYTVFAEGARGHLGRQLISKFKLDEVKDPQAYALGGKALREVDPAKQPVGLVAHSAGWPIGSDTCGGGFLYHLEGKQVTLRFVTGRARNFKTCFKKGVSMGSFMTGTEQWLLPRVGIKSPPWTIHWHKPDSAVPNPAAECQSIVYLKPDNKLSFGRLSSVFISNTKHEAQQPAHLTVKDVSVPVNVNLALYAGPERRYCPADWRSTRRTACTARPATSRIQARTSSGSRRKPVVDPITQACKPALALNKQTDTLP